MKNHTYTRQLGMTLLELITTMAMVAIIASIALPAYDTFITKNRQKSEVTNIASALYVARSEAVKRGGDTTICTSTDFANCSATANWNNGWIIFQDQDADGTVDVGDTLLEIGAEAGRGISIVGSADVNRRVQYESNGDSLQTGTITICDERGASEALAIRITASGKPKSSDTGAAGAALTCP